SYEEQSYWRDVGDIDTYYAAHHDVLGGKPKFNLFNPQWFINSSNYQGPSPRILSGDIEDSVIGAGSLVTCARIRNTILRREVVLEENVDLEDCVIMDYTIIRRGSQLKRVIVDRHNEINSHSRIGFDVVEDRARYHVSKGGVVVLSRGVARPEKGRYRM
ncbi:MAG: glucose-1-phosphate adenylyltransferase, partial [Nitrosomonadaceae bacterium]|nr:glucose-1-phosphate adenylyltransferase [Nitrosomonadaceae bacterium]